MNNVILIGRLTKDPEIRYTNDNMAIGTFTLAIDRGKDKGADFPKITVFGNQAENCNKYLSKGRLVAIAGRIRTGSYEKDGRKVFTTDVIADRVQFLEWGEKKEEPAKEEQFTVGGFEPIKDEDIPF